MGLKEDELLAKMEAIVLEEMVNELGEIPRFLTSDNFNIVVKKLKQNPQIIFIDEIDYLAIQSVFRIGEIKVERF